MAKNKLSLLEIATKVDDFILIAGKIRRVIKVAESVKDKDSPGGSKVTKKEILSIKETANEIVDAAQKLADEVVEDLLD